jgi:hypothetical protein
MQGRFFEYGQVDRFPDPHRNSETADVGVLASNGFDSTNTKIPGNTPTSEPEGSLKKATGH